MPSGLDAASLVLAVEAHYVAVRTLRAHFVQRFHHRVHQRDETWRGELLVERPGRFRIAYQEPARRVVVGDGTTVSAYIPTPVPGRYFVQASDENSMAGALAVLSGSARLDAEFDARVLDARATGFVGAVLELRPRRETPLFDRVLLYVDVGAARRGRVHRLMFVDVAGNTNRFDLDRVVEGAFLPAASFVFTPPPGALRVEP